MTAKYALFQKIDDRIVLDKDEGDYAYLNALTLKLEYLTKIISSGVISCIGDDVDRNRYTLEHELVRANSLGTWVEALNTALVGPPAEVLISDARDLSRDLTERVGAEDWRHIAVKKLNNAAIQLGVEPVSLGSKVALRRFFDIGVQLRNRTRGHGAPTTIQCASACAHLDSALDSVVHNIKILRLPWVYLHKNLSGKYRVSSLLNYTLPFDYLKSTSNFRFQNGVYFALHENNDATEPIRAPLIFTDPDILDVALPNGNYNNQTFEVLSYVTNSISRQDGSNWSDPPARLPPSETEGGDVLEPLGNSFTNTPPISSDYVPRTKPEERLLEELIKVNQHPIISLTGPGGIGKTTTAIAAIQKISKKNPALYDVILWISARDIDLLDSGPKPVSRHVFTQHDISCAAVELLEPEERSLDQFDPDQYFQKCLSDGAAGPTLFVLDNFETLQNPTEAVGWIDTYIRSPNKVLITTRFRDFIGDYPIEIGGMSNEEANDLIERHAARLGITKLLSQNYKTELVSESDGHPYVIKILLGEVVKQNRAVKPKRIF